MYLFEQGAGRVSIPHRYDSNRAGSRTSRCQRRVSIPHRYDSNESFNPVFHVDTPKVSIPHRYDSNGDFICLVPTKPREVSIPHRYDSNSSVRSGIRPARREFQFLIGTIRTFRPLRPRRRRLGVSIPHRYDSNARRSSARGARR